MHAVRLKTEYLVNPVGIDITNPRFFWNCEDGIRQTAYQIVAEKMGGGTAWDTGKVESGRMTHIEYRGAALLSRDVVLWKVKLWDEDDREGQWSDPASFEIGLLRTEDWQASWITGDYKPNKRRRYPVDCFRRQFRVEKEIRKARLYITACGLYEATINGGRVGTQCFSPGSTDYRKRLQYQVYDIGDQLTVGDNVMEIELADGWYRGGIGIFGNSCLFGTETKLLFQLEVVFADGTTQSILSGPDVSWSDDGPIRYADLKNGAVVDAAMKPTYAGRAKQTAFEIQPTASNNVPVEAHERLTTVKLVTPAGKTVLDFGQNIAGTIEFHVDAHEGQEIRLRFGEILDINGEFTQANFQVRKKNPIPRQEIRFVCKEGPNDYRMKFAVFGFRYVLVETDVKIREEDFVAVAVYSSMEETGTFECSHPLINRLVKNTLWSMKGNFLDVPTDCPTRERAGWTGDAQIFFGTGSYLMNTAPFFRKWMGDVLDRQGKDGKIQCIVPSVGSEVLFSLLDGCVGWADAVVYIPYRYWKLFGDWRFLKECYPAMKRYSKFMIGRTNKTGFLGKTIRSPYKKYTYNTGRGFGEWLEPRDMVVESPMDMMKPRPEESTAYLAHTMACMKEIADELQYSEDSRLYEEYRDGAKVAYNHLFCPDTERQSKLVRPLAFGLLEQPAEEKASARLLETIRRRNYHIGTGFLSTPLILPLLTKMGQLDAAYRMLENEEQPGWLYEPKHGATTIWEDWEGNRSNNHYSPGSVCEWLFSTVCGIQMGTGENCFIIAPQPGGSLTHASASYKSVYGLASCSWIRAEDGETKVTVAIPPNTSAQVELPDGRSMILGCGTHTLLFSRA